MRLKKAKDFFINFNKSPHQIGKELYDYLKDDLRDQFLTISDLADVQYAIQNGKVRIKILYVGKNRSTWFIDIGDRVGKFYPNKEYLPWKSIY
jgi:hypothetical protein